MVTGAGKGSAECQSHPQSGTDEEEVLISAWRTGVQKVGGVSGKDSYEITEDEEGGGEDFPFQIPPQSLKNAGDPNFPSSKGKKKKNSRRSAHHEIFL